jgi:hypothetical protein
LFKTFGERKKVFDMLKKNVKVDREDHEKYKDGLITDEPAAETTAVMDSPHQHMVSPGDPDPINQFFEWPLIRPDGAYQPIQYKTVGHLLSSGVDPSNIQAASLVHIAMLSARLGYPIPAVLVSEDPQEAIHVLDYCMSLAPKDATIEFRAVKSDHLYLRGGALLNGKCIISTEVNGFSKVDRDLELILTRGHAVRQELVKGKYETVLSEQRSKTELSFIGIDGGKPGKGFVHPSIIKIPISSKHPIIANFGSDIVEQYGLMQSPLFKIRKSFQRLRPRPVIIPFEGQLVTALVESGCDHAPDKMGILKNVISVCAIINKPPPVHKAELGAIIYETDEQEVGRWLVEAGIERASETIPEEPIVATKIDYHMARLLLDGILMTGPTRFTDRQKKVFETVKAINMGKMSTAILKDGGDVEKLATIARSSGYWATREKVFEIINNGSYDFSLSSVSNDLVALLSPRTNSKAIIIACNFIQQEVHTMRKARFKKQLTIAISQEDFEQIKQITDERKKSAWLNGSGMPWQRHSQQINQRRNR